MICDYIKFGRGKKIMILIQGLNTNGIQGAKLGLSWMYRMFSKEYTVYLFDRPKKVFEGITIDQLADSLALSMEKLGLCDAYILAVSQGGMIAQSLAIRYPHLVKKLVLAVTLSKNNQVLESVISNWLDLCEKNDIKELVLDMTKKLYSPSYVKKYQPFLPLLTILQKPKDMNRFIILCKSCLTSSQYENLHLLKCPTFVIGAKKDLIVGADASYEIQEKLNCEIFMYENLGHACYEEAKDFNLRVYNFFKQ